MSKLKFWPAAALLIAAACSTEPGPATVEVRHVDGAYQLFVDGDPFYIHGAGLEFGDVGKLAAHGGNSFRTWRTDNGESTGMQVLDRAHAHGLYVTMGIDIARERPGQGRGTFGFDYDDAEAVARQLEAVREEVLLYKDHPALLMWGIGNELNLGSTNPAVWNAVNGISEMIHAEDPHHPTTTMLAGISPELVRDITERAPDLDLLSFQSYAAIVNLPQDLAAAGWDGPYMVTEWGATGHWEVATTEWDAPIENTSSAKADFYRERYEIAIASDTTQCPGSYVFLWGQKQERTPTWYGLFLESGERTEPVDVMHYIWNGTFPDNRAPRLEGITLDGRAATDNVTLAPGMTYAAQVSSSDPDQDSLAYHWEIKPESVSLGHGGDDEAVPESIEGLIDDAAAADISITAPDESGAYRLFVYVRDGHGSAAHANVPFYVSE